MKSDFDRKINFKECENAKLLELKEDFQFSINTAENKEAEAVAHKLEAEELKKQADADIRKFKLRELQ